MKLSLEDAILSDVRAQICPLLQDHAVLDALIRLLPSERVLRGRDLLSKTQPLIMKIGMNQDTKRDKTLLDAIMYLFEVEVASNLISDILITLLAERGYFLHIEPDSNHLFIRHVVSMEDLESSFISLAVKLSFLKRHGLDCFSKYVDKDLRNRIAHMNFEIDENGNFFEYRKEGMKNKRKLIDVTQKLTKLIHFNSIVIHEMKLALEKGLKMKSALEDTKASKKQPQ